MQAISNPDRYLGISSNITLIENIGDDIFTIEQARKIVIDARVPLGLDESDSDYHEKLLPTLVSWFANEFFNWFDVPECEGCGAEMSGHNSYVNREGKMVEEYKCSTEQCDSEYQFVRHDEPAILINTRRGRCGEWAKCFYAFLVSMGYDARFVLDSTDHCWNEVWSNKDTRWIHVDPCEQVIDKPLLYEIGWGKELQYCIAFGMHDVLDVTKRYTTKYNEVKTRRLIITDDELNDFLNTISESKIYKIESDDLQLQIMERRLIDISYLENIENITRVVPDKSEFTGRKTGNIRWRIARGEYSPTLEKRFVIKVTKPVKIMERVIFRLVYDSEKNEYKSNNPEYNSKDWSSLVYRALNLDYKYERDWRTSYLARYETCPYNEQGHLEWRFDLNQIDTIWTEMEIFIASKCYPDTSVKISLYCLDGDQKSLQDALTLKDNEMNKIEKSNIHDDTKVIAVLAILFGGSPDDTVAWQKPQLFRQTRGEESCGGTFRILILR